MKPALINKPNAASSEFSLIGNTVTKYFRINRLCLQGKIKKEEDGFYAGVVVKGKGSIAAGNLEHELKFGDKFFVPYKTTSEGMEIIIAKPPV